MLSIEVCRKILGVSKEEMPDCEIKELQESLYQIGNILINKRFEEAKDGNVK